MTDADTPRVPDLWWSPTEDFIHRLASTFYRFVGDEKCLGTELPADAVKLGDVEEVRELLDRTRRSRDNHMNRAIRAERERDALRADIRAVLVDFGQLGEPGRPNQTTALEALERIDACLDREPGREEPKPRVFLPGDTVPAEVEVWTKDRAVYRWGTDRQLLPYEGAMVEVLYPSPAEWQAIVDRARAARGHVVEHQPDTEERS